MDNIFEQIQDPNIQALLDGIQEIIDADDVFVEEELDTIIKAIQSTYTPGILQQSMQQMIDSLDAQGTSKEDAKKAVNALIEYLDHMIYDKNEFTENKKRVVDAIIQPLYIMFREVAERYHSYAIELPMTLAEGAKAPTYAHDSDAAADLYALEDITLEDYSYGNKIRTGVSIGLPEGWLALIIPRSSIGAKTPLRLSNSVGLIDSGYRGELGVLYDNVSDEPWEIHAGDRIAQLLVMPNYRFKANIVDTLEETDRGEGGFGSTGV
jgi:dUTP pyrophosphatase